MSNTLKFGNGEWYGKEGTILAYNSENNNYKPLPFTFDRASSATRVNKDGLIETVGADQPRVDYLNDSNGALLLEPSRTNLVTYSEAFDNSYWTKDGASVVGGFASPSADSHLGAFKLIENSSNSKHRIYSPNLTVSNGATVTTSVFVKSDERSWFLLQESTTDYGYYFNNGNVGSSTGSPLSYNIDKLENGWYRYSITTVTPNTNARLKINIVKENGGSTEYQGDGTSGVYIYGAQLEQGSYATSIINTSGSAVTRLADVCNGAGNEQVINSTEGVLYAEIAALADDLTFRSISINANDTRDDQVMIRYRTNSNVISFFIRDGGSVTLNQNVIVQDITKYNKVALKYKNGDISAWINGVEYITSTATGMPSGLNKIGFQLEDPNVDPFFGNVKDLRVYNTALSDSELQALTT